MLEENFKENDLKSLENENIIKIKDLSSQNIEEKKDNNNTNYKNDPKERLEDNINKISSKNIEDLHNNISIGQKLKKVKTFNKDNRKDRFGNKIAHGGHQKVSFLDKISKNNLTEVIKVENLKEYNKIEEPINNRGNCCCLLL